MIIEVNPNKKNKICSPVIGFEAENKVTGFEFDYSDWAADIGDGYLTLSVKRPTDTIPYPVSLTQTGTHKATWTVSSTDVAFAGRGEVQLTYIVDDKVKKSAIYEILIDRSLEPDGDIPDPYISWFEELLQVSVQVEADVDRAEAAADSIKNLEAVAVTLPSGESATAEYDPETGVMSFGIPKGDKGDTGDVGPTGNGISSTVLNADYTLTINFTDGTSYTTPSIRGEQGIQGETGENGNGIASTVLNPDYTLTITFTNGTTYTTPSIRGPEGAQGQTGPTGNGIDNVTMDASGYLTITFTDGSTWTSPTSLFGPVQDVKVNGESVVDENGVANITVPIITKTVSGNPIVVDDADGAVQALDVELLPKQEGTPTQDSTIYNEPYLSKTSPSFNSEYDKLVGGTVAWNQLVNPSKISATQTINGVTFTNNGDGSVSVSGTATANTYFDIIGAKTWTAHKYLLKGCPSGGSSSTYALLLRGQASPTNDFGNGAVWDASTYAYKGMQIYVASGTVLSTPIVYNPQLFDLTQMFGSTIADYVYSLEQGTAGSGIAFLKSYDFFTKDYYPYNEGELISVKPTAHVTSETYSLAGVDLRGIPKISNGALYYDGDTYESSGTVTRKYGIRAYQSGDESDSTVITDLTNTVYPLATSTTETVTGFTSPQTVGSTESYTDNRAVPIPVGHESRYANIYPITGYDNVNITDSNGADTTTTTITLPHTVYGADVDVTGGESKETWQNIASYNGETISEPWLSSMDEYVQGATPTTGAQVCYELATPTDLQTTPTDVELFKGDNVVSGDGTMTLTYVRNLQKVIDKIESAL